MPRRSPTPSLPRGQRIIRPRSMSHAPAATRKFTDPMPATCTSSERTMRRHEQSGNLQVEHRRAWALAVVLGASLWPAISLAQENAPAATGATQTENTTPAQPTERIKHGYAVHETADLGGHIASIDGSGAMYNTLVNVHPGPRVLGQTFELRAVEGSKHLLFDNLNAFTTGFGGDPNNVATLRFSKGKSYDFDGLFRRDRQYFDYNLLANPLVPSA